MDERPGGEWFKMDGKRPRGRDENGGKDSCLKWSRSDGSSMEERIRSWVMSVSE